MCFRLPCFLDFRCNGAVAVSRDEGRGEVMLVVKRSDSMDSSSGRVPFVVRCRLGRLRARALLSG